MKRLFFLYTLIMSLLCVSCYSFSGASINPAVKTFSVSYFNNNAEIVNPTLSQTITEALKDKFLSRTSLKLVDNGGDMDFIGTITSYNTTPQAITNDQVAAMNRLSVTINVKYTNAVDNKLNFVKSYTRYQDYDSSLSLSEVESSLVDEIVAQLVDDIFNETAVNW